MPMNTRRSVIVLMIAAFGIIGCANPPLAPTPEVREVLAPTGTLRLGLFPGTPGQMIRDPSTGDVRGVGYELGRAFATLDIPVLYMLGGASPESSHAVARALVPVLPRVRVVEFPGLGHMAPVTHPERINVAIAKFIGEY